MVVLVRGLARILPRRLLAGASVVSVVPLVLPAVFGPSFAATLFLVLRLPLVIFGGGDGQR